jgi:hypothetical protein
MKADRRAELQLHSFLTLALQRGKTQPHALADLSSLTMLYELQNVECYVHTLQVIFKAVFDQELPYSPPSPYPVWTPSCVENASYHLVSLSAAR